MRPRVFPSLVWPKAKSGLSWIASISAQSPGVGTTPGEGRFELSDHKHRGTRDPDFDSVSWVISFIANWFQFFPSSLFANHPWPMTHHPSTTSLPMKIRKTKCSQLIDFERVSSGFWVDLIIVQDISASFVLQILIFHLVGSGWDGHWGNKHGWDQSHCLPSQSPTNHPQIFLAYQFFCTEN